MNVDIFEQRVDGSHVFHFSVYVPGVPGGRRNAPAVCGIPISGMRPVAPFPVGDRRGAVHVIDGCDNCIQGISDIFDAQD